MEQPELVSKEAEVAAIEIPSFENPEFLPVDSNDLVSHRVTELPLYLYNQDRKRYVLFKQAGEPISQEQLNQLSRDGHRAVFVPGEHRTETHNILADTLGDILQDQSLEPMAKSQKVYRTACNVIRHLFEVNPDNKTFMATANKVSNAVADLVTKDPMASMCLNRLRSYDYTTYSHSLNVCILGLGLYQHMNPSSESETMRDLSRGLLLHDIGKTDLPTELITKRGPLSSDEWDMMKSHTTKGYQRLQFERLISEDAREIALLHHEAIDGSGYPLGKTKKEIPFTSRLCKVVDVYDALSSNRSYKDAYSPYQTLQVMITEMKHQVDDRVMRELIVYLEKMSKLNVRREPASS